MGDISPIDLINIDRFAKRVVALADYGKQLFGYLEDRMKMCAPNLSSLIGDLVGARLISHAGSLTNLAKCPASTVQILGAEKALFRALKTKGNTPKYGLIFHSSFIGRAGAKNKGRISRYLANKCSIASRIDCFSEESTTIFGTKLKEQVEDRLKFYETGDLPRKNVEVMAEAVEEAAEDAKKKKKKEKKKRKAEDTEEPVSEEAATEEPPKKKKKKNKDKDVVAEAAETTVNTTADVEDETPKKKKKNKKNKEEKVEAAAAETTMNTTTEAESPKKKKKKSKVAEDEVEANGDVSLEEVVPAVSEKKKKKKKNKDVEA